MNKPEAGRLLAINSGSSSVKFALFAPGSPPSRLAWGIIERMGSVDAKLELQTPGGAQSDSAAPLSNHKEAAAEILLVLEPHLHGAPLAGIGHRIVHGGPRYSQPTRVTPELLAELRQLSAYVPNHLPAEIAMIEALQQAVPQIPQVACFDTAFHHDLPDVSRRLPIPRKYDAQGIRRYGFHGLSYQFLMEELARVAGAQVAGGRVILAHLGSGASLAAVRGGKSIDTSMGFTPTGGLVMGTRTGDLDPGLIAYLLRTEDLNANEVEDLINRQSGLLGMSEVSSDMRDLIAKQEADPRCAQAVAVFCYQVRKWIGAFAAALGGLDTLVFSGGIGEHASEVRLRICQELGFLGIEIDETKNAASAPIISVDARPVEVRVIPTDEELMIAKSLVNVLFAKT
jgi:acetate kinase